MSKTRYFRAFDIVPVLVVLAAAVGLFCLQVTAGSAAEVIVTTPHETVVLPLGDPTTRTFEGRDGLTLTVCVENGAAFVRQADCPDQVCVHTGVLDKNGQTAACVPSGIVITVGGGDAAVTDAVSR